MSVELVLIMPLVVVFLFFIADIGRLAEARGQVQAAASDAARAASVQRSAADGDAAANAAVVSDLAGLCPGDDHPVTPSGTNTFKPSTSTVPESGDLHRHLSGFGGSPAPALLRENDVCHGVRAVGDLPPVRAMTSRDEGAAAVFFVIFLLVAFPLAGLVIDGGLAIDGRGRAADVAEQAARSAADNIDVNYLRSTGLARIDNAKAACGLAKFVLDASPDVSRSGANWCVLSGDHLSITVKVQTTVHTAILGIIGFTTFTVGAQAVAHPVAG